jgi:hypothetical protein
MKAEHVRRPFWTWRMRDTLPDTGPEGVPLSP